MVNNKKALSTVVTTLIIILLVLVAIGIIWVVINNVVSRGTSNIDYTVKCLEVDLKATAVNCTGISSCAVTLTRGSRGDSIDGVKLVFSNAVDGASSVIDSAGNINPLQTLTKTIDISGEGFTQTPTKLEVTAYILDDTNTKRMCQTYSFSI